MKMKLKIGTQTFPKVFSSLFSCQATCHLRHESDILSRSKIVFTYLKITYYYLFLLYIFLKSRPRKLLTIIMKAVDIAIFYEMTWSIDSMSGTYILKTMKMQNISNILYNPISFFILSTLAFNSYSYKYLIHIGR